MVMIEQNDLLDGFLKGLQNYSRNGTSFKILPTYVSAVSEDGADVWVSPLESDLKYKVTLLSLLPSNKKEGTRVQAVPFARGTSFVGSKALCAIIDNKWYLLGYYNDMSADGDSAAEQIELEAIKPYKGGLLFKISETGQIIMRKANQFLIYFGTESKFKFIGKDPSNPSSEEEYFLEIANKIEKI